MGDPAVRAAEEQVMRETVERHTKKLSTGNHRAFWMGLAVFLGTTLISFVTWTFIDLRSDYHTFKQQSEATHRATVLTLQLIAAQQRQTCRVTVMLAHKQGIDTTAIDCTPVGP